MQKRRYYKLKSKKKDIDRKFAGADTSKYRVCEGCKKILPLTHYEVTSKKRNGTKIYKEICKRCSDTLKKVSTVEQEDKADGNVIEINEEQLEQKEVRVTIPLIHIEEVFTQVKNTNSYWLSNYGRNVFKETIWKI